MTYRAPSNQRRRAIAEIVGLLAAELERDDAHQTLQAIAVAADNTYPARASSTPAEPANQTDTDGRPLPPPTPTEQAALGVDRVAFDSRQALTDFATLETAARRLLTTLWSWRPDRTFTRCERCGHPLPRGITRCRRVDPDTGRACNTSVSNLRVCMICDKVMAPGQPLRAGRCDACRKFRERNGRDRITTQRLTYHREVGESLDGAGITGPLHTPPQP